MKNVIICNKGILIILVAFKKCSFGPLSSSWNWSDYLLITTQRKEINKKNLINYALSIYLINKSKLINYFVILI